MKKILALIFFLPVMLLQSQEFQWLHARSVEYTYNPAFVETGVFTNPQGNLLFTGLNEITSSQGYGSIFFQQLSPNGELLNEIIIEGEGKAPSKLAFDPEGNMYFLIQYNEDLTWGENIIEKYTEQVNLALVKLNTAFDIEWIQYDEVYYSNYISKPIIYFNDHIYFTKRVDYSGSVIRKIDLDGNVIMEVTQDNVGYVSSLDIDTDGNILVAGSCAGEDASYNGVPFPSPDFYNVFVAKYNSEGVPQWVNYAIDITCINPEVKVSDSDHIYLAGLLMVEMEFGNIMMEGPSWVYDFYMMRLNAAGEFLWGREVPDITSGDATLSNNSLGDFTVMKIDDDHNVYMTGFIRGSIDWGNGIVTNSTDIYYDMLTLSYDELGNMRFAISGGGTNWDVGHSVALANDGNLYISGLSSGSVTYGDIQLDGPEKFFFVTRFGFPPSSGDQPEQIPAFNIFPNPSKGFVMIVGEDISQVSVFNDIGQLFLEHENKSGSTSFEFDLSNIPEGVYLFKIFQGDNFNTRKILLK